MSLKRTLSAASIASGAIAVWAVCTPAAASQPTFGAQALATEHRCSPLPANGDCPAFNNSLKTVFNGGPGSGSASASVVAAAGTVQEGSYAFSSAGFGDLNLPVLRASVFAAGTDSRMNGTAQAFETYTYLGADPTAFSIAGNLQFEDSSVGSSDVTAAGSGGYQIYVGIYAADQFSGQPSFGQCGTAGVLGAYLTPGVGTLPGGSFSVPVVTQACNGTGVVLTQGEQIVIEADLILITNRGGFADASHTFTTFLDPTLGDQVTENLRDNLDPGGVPEPSVWALMLAGFSLAGAGLRGARRRALAA